MNQDAAKRAVCQCEGCSGCAPHVCRPEWSLVVLCKVCYDAAVAEARREERGRAAVEVASWHCPQCGHAPLTTVEGFRTILDGYDQFSNRPPASAPEGTK